MLSIEETPPTWLPFPPSSLCPVLLGRPWIPATLLGPPSECPSSALRPSCPRCLSAEGQWVAPRHDSHSPVSPESPRWLPEGQCIAAGGGEEQWRGRSLLLCHHQRHHQPQKIEKGVTLSLALLEKFLRSPCFCPTGAQTTGSSTSSTDTQSPVVA